MEPRSFDRGDRVVVVDAVLVRVAASMEPRSFDRGDGVRSLGIMEESERGFNGAAVF